MKPHYIQNEEFEKLHRYYYYTSSTSVISCFVPATGTQYPFSLQAEEHFSHQEIGISLILLKDFPHFSYHSHLLSVLDAISVDEAQNRIDYAMSKGELRFVLSSLKNNMSRARMKLYSLGFDIKSLPECGYVLIPVSQEQVKGRPERFLYARYGKATLAQRVREQKSVAQ